MDIVDEDRRKEVEKFRSFMLVKQTCGCILLMTSTSDTSSGHLSV